MGASPERGQPFHANNAFYDVIALAASAGGLEALSSVISPLPPDFPAALLVVQHLSPDRKSMLAAIISRLTALKTCEAKDGDTLKPGSIYIAPPDQHLIVLQYGTISLVHSDRVKFVRPSADILFVSVASVYPGRAIAVILTGFGSDGTTGALAIKKSGGVVIAQDQATSQYFGMPGSAIDSGAVDYILPLDKISAVVQNLTLTGTPT
jgi:two-component system chemotaxis response regulator CheB